jgi:hypothetical protein
LNACCATSPPVRKRLDELVIASEAKQSRTASKDWIASSQELLAMTARLGLNSLHSSGKKKKAAAASGNRADSRLFLQLFNFFG